MSGDDTIRVFKAGAIKVNHVPRDECVRLFCEMHARTWGLQVRGPARLGGSFHGKEGKDFIVAHATLERDGMIALRDAIDKALQEK